MKLTARPTRATERWIAWIAIAGGLASAAFHVFSLVSVGTTVVALVGLATSLVLFIIGLWARQIAESLPS